MNRVLGWIFTIAVIAIVVFAALNWGGYSSMCFNGGEAEREAAETVEATDTTYVDDAVIVENESEERQEVPLTVGEKVVEASATTQSAL